jgi:hypothetical protein
MSRIIRVHLLIAAARLVAAAQREGARHVGPPGAFPKEIGGPERRDLLGDRDIDELNERRALGLRQPLGLGLDRRLQPQGLFRLSHPLLHDRHAAGTLDRYAEPAGRPASRRLRRHTRPKRRKVGIGWGRPRLEQRQGADRHRGQHAALEAKERGRTALAGPDTSCSSAR